MISNILIIGVGSIGERHTRCFLNSGRVQPSICELNPELRQSVAARYQVPAYASLEEALALGDFQAAVVCSPAHTHIPLARQLLRAGLHIFVEKPLSQSFDDVETFVSDAEQSGRVVRVAYTSRYNPLYQRVRQLLPQAGKLLQIISVTGQNFPTFRPAYRDIYYARHETGGGAIQDALTHHVDLISWLAGPADSVFCSAAHQALDGVEVEDTVNAIAHHGPALVSYSLNQFQAPNEAFLFLHGEKGSVRADNTSHRCGFMAPGGEWEWEEIRVPERDDTFTDQAHAFLDACEGKDNHLCTLPEAVRVLRFNLGALQSAREKRLIDL